METSVPSVATPSVPVFTLRTSTAAPGRVDARLVGDLDLANAPLVRDELLRMLDDGLDALSIDLAGLTFLDSTGIAMLIVVRKRALELGVEFDVHSPRTGVLHVFEACGVDDLLGLRAPDPAC